MRSALEGMQIDLLAWDVEGALGPPTLNEIATRLTGGGYTLLHLVAHGQLLPDPEGPTLFLSEEDGDADKVAGQAFIDRLSPVKLLPHVVFLASCDSARPDNGKQADFSLGNLAQLMMGQLGLAGRCGHDRSR